MLAIINEYWIISNKLFQILNVYVSILSKLMIKIISHKPTFVLILHPVFLFDYFSIYQFFLDIDYTRKQFH